MIWRKLVVVLFFAFTAVAHAQIAAPQNPDQRHVVFSFDHVLSIYEWHGLVDYTSLKEPSSLPSPLFDIHLRGNSRFLTLDSLATTDASGIITAMQPLTSAEHDAWLFAPYITLAGNSYVTTPRPGKLVGSLITKQASGYAVGGLQLTAPDRSFFSAGVGIARQTEAAFSTGATSATTPVGATGLMLTSYDSLAMQSLSEGEILNAAARGDERFFRERNERYSNDSLRFMLLSGTDDPTSAQNMASVQLALLRRDFFYSPDSNTSLRQERVQYALRFSDSLMYPITQDVWRAHVAFEIEPYEISRNTDAPASSYISSGFSTFSTLMAPSTVSSVRTFAQVALTAGEEVDTMPKWSGNARMTYGEHSETIALTADALPGVETAILRKLSETLNQASYSSRMTALDATLRYAPSVHRRTELQGTTRLLSYDTPSDLNHDNHDDLVTSLSLRHHEEFSEHLRYDASLRASRDHLVYLKSDRSAQNAVTHSLLLSSLATYASRPIYASAGGEVFANYTVFDYANILPALSLIGNYVLRGMTISDTLAVTLGTVHSKRVQIALEEGSAMRVSERGSYSDSAFTERRETEVQEFGASLFLSIASNYLTPTPWTLRLGARGFVTSHLGRSSATSNPSFGELARQTRFGPAFTAMIGRLYDNGPYIQGSLWYAWNWSKQANSSLPATRTLQPESYLTAAWTF